MAITIDGKVYRNLEEQVEKNRKDIAEFKEQAQSLSQFGIKVVSQVAVEGLIPSVIAYKAAHSDWEYGDTYAVGSEAPYKLYILTRADEDDHPEDYWFNIGQFPVAGPQGAQGIQGETGPQGTRGSKWSVGTSFPSSAQTGDLFLYSTTSQVYQYNGSTWDSVASIKGAQGIQGIQGIQGVQGIQGPQGPQGVQGPVGGTFTIKSTLSSTSLLPDPDESPRNEAYLIPVNNINHIYIIEEVDDALSWVDAGQFTGAQGIQGPRGEQGPIGPTGTTGSAALMFKGGVLESDTEPAVNTEFTGLYNSDFSRVPTGYDYCIAAISYNDGTQVHSYIANCQVTFSTQNTPQLKVVELVETTGAQGAQGEIGALNSSEEITYDSTSQSCLLASTVRNKINSALQTPAVAPTSHVLVGIDSSNAQENISIGSGLEIDNGALKATGGGYTAGQNISISSAGVISVDGTQSGSGSLAIKGKTSANYCTAIGANAAAITGQSSVAVGYNALTSQGYGVAVGGNALCNYTKATAIGYDTKARGQSAIALGYSAIANANNAVQIGEGTNSTSNSLQYKSTQIAIDGVGITTANLAGPPSGSADGTYTLKCVRSGGVNTIQWVLDT